MKITIRKSARKNKFYVHNIIKNQHQITSASTKNSAKAAYLSGANDIVPQSSKDVNNNIQFRDRDYISAVERGDIPLSERFKTDNKDIRFQDRDSISSEDELLANVSTVKSALIYRIKQNKTDAVSVFEPRL